MRHIAILVVIALSLSQLATAQDAAKTREPGGTVAIGATASATVKSIDAAKRIVTLETPDGDLSQVKCGAEVRNFDQIKVGDTVKAAAMAQLVVAVGKDATPGDAAGVIIARAPKGARPGAFIAQTEEVTAKIDAINADKQMVTLSGIAEKPQQVQVAADVDLSKVKVGDDVVVKVTKGLALWVEHPGDAPSAPPTAPSADSATAAKAEDARDVFAIEGATATATVTAIDPAKRIVTLQSDTGGTKSIHLGKECVNFDQIKVGDKVRSTVAEEVAVLVSKSGALPASVDGGMVALAPKGAKPGILIANTDDITAKIESIDAAKRTVTLKEADGTSHKIKVAQGVKLEDLKVGDDVSARVTQALAIVVEKP